MISAATSSLSYLTDTAVFLMDRLSCMQLLHMSSPFDQRLLEPSRHIPTNCSQDDVDDLLGVGLSDPCFTTFTLPMIMSSVTLLV